MKTYDEMIVEIGKVPESPYDIHSSGICCSYYEERPAAIDLANRVRDYDTSKGHRANVSISGLHVTVNVSGGRNYGDTG